jgi:peroxiredoxin
MKNYRFIALLAVLSFAACRSKDAQPVEKEVTVTENKIIVNVAFAGIDTGRLYVMYDNDDAQRQQDSFRLEGGRCSYTIPVSSLRSVYNGVGDEGFFIYLAPGEVNLSGHIDSVFYGRLSMSGSGLLPEAQWYYVQSADFVKANETALRNAKQLRNSADAGNAATLAALGRFMTAAKYKIDSAFTKQYPASPITAALLLEKYGFEGAAIAEIKQGYAALGEAAKNGYYGQQLSGVLQQSATTNNGNTAMDFVLPDINGNMVSLTSFRGKYVLVDFWASWCRPCREENPYVVAAWKTFKDKGFDILGVSLDESAEEWVNAIQQDQLAWQHVSDLKGWESDVAKLYKIEGIPANFLLDPQGNIIARDLRGGDLVNELKKLLK